MKGVFMNTEEKKQAPREQGSRPAKVAPVKKDDSNEAKVSSWVKDISGGGRDMYL